MSNQVVDFVSESGKSKRLPSLLYRFLSMVIGAGLAFVLCLGLYLINLFDIGTATYVAGRAAICLAILSFRPFMLAIVAGSLGIILRGKSRELFEVVVFLFAFSATMSMLVHCFLWVEKTSANSDWIRLQLHRSHYMTEVDQACQGRAALCFRSWTWGHIGSEELSGTFYYVVYDGADQIIRPPEQRMAQWRTRVGLWDDICPQPDDTHATSVKSLGDHFYFVSMSR